MFYTMFQHQTQTECLVRCLIIELAENKQNKENIKDRRVKGTVCLLTQFGATSPTSRGYQARNEIHYNNINSKYYVNHPRFTREQPSSLPSHLITTRVISTYDCH